MRDGDASRHTNTRLAGSFAERGGGQLQVFLMGDGVTFAVGGQQVPDGYSTWTGGLSDRIGRKWLIAGGMWVQAVALGLYALGTTFGAWAVAAVLLGAGTAMVYPTLLAAIGDVAQPAWRARSVGVWPRRALVLIEALPRGEREQRLPQPAVVPAVHGMSGVDSISLSPNVGVARLRTCQVLGRGRPGTGWEVNLAKQHQTAPARGAGSLW